MIDQSFLEEPRLLMGLNKRNREVLRPKKEDEDARFRRSSVTNVEKSGNGSPVEQP